MNTVDSTDKQTSRWDELSNFAKIIIEIAAVFNSNGCDVHFLNMQGVKNVRSFDQLSLYFRRPTNVFTNIVACTNDERSIGYLNGLDRELPRLDVVDDYASELAEIRRIKGSNFQFTFGDYVTKSILGSISPDLDRYDETPIQIPASVPAPIAVQPQKTTITPTRVVPKPNLPKKKSLCSRLHILSPDYSSDSFHRKYDVPHLKLADLLCCV